MGRLENPLKRTLEEPSVLRWILDTAVEDAEGTEPASAVSVSVAGAEAGPISRY